jgi:hypothetical protein
MKRLLIALLMLCLPASAWSATITAANGGGNYSATSSFVGGVLPDPATDTLVIPATMTAALTIDTSRTIPPTTIEDEIYGLVVATGVTVTLGGVLTVGNGSAKDGKFTFGAGSTLALEANSLTLNNCALASNALTDNWAKVTGSGSIIKGAVYTTPKQNYYLRYISFQNTGSITFTTTSTSGAVTPGADIQYCTFYGQSTVAMGSTSTSASTNLVMNSCDFRDLVTKITLAGATPTTGKREFKNNTLASNHSLTAFIVRSLNGPWDFAGTVSDRCPMGRGEGSTGAMLYDGWFWGSTKIDDDFSNRMNIGWSSAGSPNHQFIHSYVYSPPGCTNPHVMGIPDSPVAMEYNIWDIHGSEPNDIISGTSPISNQAVARYNIAVGAGALHSQGGDKPLGTGGQTFHNNTRYVETPSNVVGIHAGLALFENGNTEFVPVFHSNLMQVKSGINLAYAVIDNVAPAQVIDSDYNSFYGLSSGVYKTGITNTTGTHDISVDPQFYDPTRNLATWGKIIHNTDGSVQAAIDKIVAKNGYNPATKTQYIDYRSGATIWGSDNSLVNWVRKGFTPQNLDLLTAGYSSTYIGAVQPEDLTPETATGAALMMGN